MKRVLNEAFVKDIVTKMIDRKEIHSAVFSVESGDGSLALTAAAGDMKSDDRYFIASVTKLYVTAVVLMLKSENQLSLEDRIVDYFPKGMLKGLHVLDGVEYTDEITVRHLISNTSGIPDYFFGKTSSGKKAATELLEGKDEAWPLERILETVRNIKPRFRPGKKGKALYSDTNYELLGAIIEKITGKPIDNVFKEFIFDKLGLQNTYSFKDENDETPAQLYYKTNAVRLPKYLASVTVEGGIVSTAEEVMRFLKAFFAGEFFPVEEIDNLKRWNMVFGPGLFLFGIGLEKFYLPFFMKPFFPIGETLGFWGQTSAFAWYNVQNDIYLTGTANQLGGRGHRLASDAIMKTIKAKANQS